MTDQDMEQRLVPACAVADIEDGEILKAEIDGLGVLAIYRVGSLYFASDDICTHGKASLADDGYLDGFTVTCSWHDGAFDIRTGEPCALPCNKALRTYPVVVRDGQVYIAA